MKRRRQMKGLLLHELLELCEEAGGLYVRRLGRILGDADPSDSSLRDLLREMIVEGEGHLESVRLYTARVPASRGRRLGEPERGRLLKEHFPSVVREFGAGGLDRDVSLYFADTLVEEYVRFHRTLAGNAPDPESASFFLNLSESGRVYLEHLRTVLL